MTTIADNAAEYLDQRITAVVSARFEAAEEERRHQEMKRAAFHEEVIATFRARFEHDLNDAALLSALDLRYMSEDREISVNPVPYATFTVDEAELRIYEYGGNAAYYRLIDPQKFNSSGHVVADMSAITLADDLLFGIAAYRERIERRRQEQAEAAERAAQYERERAEREEAWKQSQVKAPEPPTEPARIISDSGMRRTIELSLDEQEAKIAILTRSGLVELVELAAQREVFDGVATPPQRFQLASREMQMLIAAWQTFHAAATTDTTTDTDDIPF